MKKRSADSRKRRAIILSAIWILSYLLLLGHTKIANISGNSASPEIMLLVAVLFYLLPMMILIYKDAKAAHIKVLEYAAKFFFFVCAIWIPLCIGWILSYKLY